MQGMRERNGNVFEEAERFDSALSKTAPVDEDKIYQT